MDTVIKTHSEDKKHVFFEWLALDFCVVNLHLYCLSTKTPMIYFPEFAGNAFLYIPGPSSAFRGVL